MRMHYGLIGFLCVAAALFAPFALSVIMAEHQPHAAAAQPPSATPEIAQGRYVATLGGCNDCHTQGFIQAEGKTPEPQWLMGDATGWYGPWGTTYAANLRLFVPSMSEDAWVPFARQLKTKPPMPWWALHEMREPDLRALYQFIKTLGPKGEAVPQDLPPGQKPDVPYVAFVLQPTSAVAAQSPQP